MNKTTLYALAGAALFYFRSRTKKGRPMAAAKGAALGWLAAAKIAPALKINLPAPANIL